MRQIHSFVVDFLGVAFFAMAFSGSGFASETRIDVELVEIYSNNITLLPDNVAMSDSITRISPSLLFTREGRAIDFSFDYSYELFLYASNSDFNQDYHQLDTTALAHLIGDELTVQGQVIFTQVSIDPAKPTQDSNLSVTGNRSDGLLWGVTPQWQRQLPLNSIIDVSYSFGRISYDDPGIQELNTQTLAFRLASDPGAGLPLTYELNYNYLFFDYETTGSIRDQNLFFSLSQEIGYGFSLVGLVGLDSDFSDLQNSTLSEGRWEVGFDSADEDGHLRAMIGHRYFGTVLRFSVGRTFSSWHFEASYLEEPGTAESVFLQSGGSEVPVDGSSSAPEPPPPPGIDRPGTAARFFRKRMDGIVQWDGRRSSVIFTTWWDQRDNISGNPAAGVEVPADDDSYGAVLSYEWEIGGHTTAGLTGSWIRRKFTEEDDQTVFNEIDNWTIGAGISYLLGLKTSLRPGLIYRESSGNDIGDNFSEFQASISLTRSF